MVGSSGRSELACPLHLPSVCRKIEQHLEIVGQVLEMNPDLENVDGEHYPLHGPVRAERVEA